MNIVLKFQLPSFHTPPLRGNEPGPNSWQAFSHQMKKEVRRMSKISPRRRQCLIMPLWMIHGVPGIDHGPLIQWVTFLRFSLFQNPATMSFKVNKHFRSLMNFFLILNKEYIFVLRNFQILHNLKKEDDLASSSY